jgi:hypothetical protein
VCVRTRDLLKNILIAISFSQKIVRDFLCFELNRFIKPVKFFVFVCVGLLGRCARVRLKTTGAAVSDSESL